MGPTPERVADRNRVVQSLVRDELAAGRSFRIEVTSGSMRPLIRPGDRIVLAPVEAAHTRTRAIFLSGRQVTSG